MEAEKEKRLKKVCETGTLYMVTKVDFLKNEAHEELPNKSAIEVQNIVF